MRCKKWNQQMDAYLDGELTPEEGQALEEHLDRCHRCAAALEETKRAVSAVAWAPRAEAPEGLLTAIMGRVEEAAALACEAVRPELAPLADAELEPVRKRAIEGHLVLCPSCSSVFAQMTDAKEAVQRYLVPAKAPRGLVGEILAATTRPTQQRWLGRVLAPRRMGYALATATAAAVFVGLLFYLPHGGQFASAPTEEGAIHAGAVEVVEAPISTPHVPDGTPPEMPGAATHTTPGTGPATPPARPSGHRSHVALPRAPASTTAEEISAAAYLAERGERGVDGPEAGLEAKAADAEVVSPTEPAEEVPLLPTLAGKRGLSPNAKAAPVLVVVGYWDASAEFDPLPSDRSFGPVSDRGPADRERRSPSPDQKAPAFLRLPF